MSHPSSLSAIKAATQSKTRNLEDQQSSERDALVLILAHLQSRGFLESATSLLQESMPLKLYEQADNLDLVKILKEYESFYEMRFGKRPVFCRPVQNENSGSTGNTDNSTANQSKYDTRSQRKQPTKHKTSRNSTLPPLKSSAQQPSRKRSYRDETKAEEKSNVEEISDGVTGFAMESSLQARNSLKNDVKHKEESLKPLPCFGGDMELRSLAMSIRQDIIQTSPGISWDSIVDLNDVKRLLKEAIILPRKYPQLFTGLRSPWRSVLLHGSPGVGKTLLAKAVASESSTVFFNISASSIVSKYRGDSEKLVKVLFELARYYAPSTIFFDEIDSILGHRGGIQGSIAGNEGSEHEGSRRMKTELLVQMDGLMASNTDVFVLAASNLPWDLDAAFLRRMEKRVFIPLPAKQARKEMIRSHLSEFPLSPAFQDDLFDVYAHQTGGFSGSDIKTLCKEVSMRPLRRMLTQLEQSNASIDQNLSLLIKKNPITSDDFRESLTLINQSTDNELCRRHQAWSESHGSG